MKFPFSLVYKVKKTLFSFSWTELCFAAIKKKWYLAIIALTFTSVEEKANVFNRFREKNTVKCQMSKTLNVHLPGKFTVTQKLFKSLQRRISRLSKNWYIHVSKYIFFVVIVHNHSLSWCFTSDATYLKTSSFLLILKNSSHFIKRSKFAKVWFAKSSTYFWRKGNFSNEINKCELWG